MGEPLKQCSGAEAVKKFLRVGSKVERQKGSHVMMTKEGHLYTLSIPQHSELGPGILRKLIRQTGMTIEEFNLL